MGATILLTEAPLAASAQRPPEEHAPSIRLVKPDSPPLAIVTAEGIEAIVVRAAHVNDEVLVAQSKPQVVVRHALGLMFAAAPSTAQRDARTRPSSRRTR